MSREIAGDAGPSGAKGTPQDRLGARQVTIQEGAEGRESPVDAVRTNAFGPRASFGRRARPSVRTSDGYSETGGAREGDSGSSSESMSAEEPPRSTLPVRARAIAPKIVFIVPYRDRAADLALFSEKMRYVLEDVPESEYCIYYVHQCDARSFNRGAMKNIGFMAVRELYPDSYRTITLVFNDVDTTPSDKNLLEYATVPGTIKHFYGFTFTLGGIVSISGGDFEDLNGFINMWAWGFEDNALNDRALANGIRIDRSTFFRIADARIDARTNGHFRTVNRAEFSEFQRKTPEGVSSIRGLTYDIDEPTGFINVREFDTGREENAALTSEYDLRHGPAPFKAPQRPYLRPMMKMRM